MRHPGGPGPFDYPSEDPLGGARRLLLYGVTGAGRTTAPARISEATEPMAGVNLVVALDYPRWLSLQPLVRRIGSRAVDRRPICNGNTESWSSMLGNDCIIRWHFRSFDSKRARVTAGSTEADPPRVLCFSRPGRLEDWIASLRPVEAGAHGGAA